jgi:hypothetical protein
MRVGAVMVRVAVVLVCVLIVVRVFALDKVDFIAQRNHIRLIAESLDYVVFKLY